MHRKFQVMNNRFQYIKKAALHFSKWSRNSWAVFGSLGREVTIGHLNVSICDRALLKTACLKQGMALNVYATEEVAFEHDQSDGLVSEWCLALLLLLVLPLLTLADLSSSHSLIKKQKNKITGCGIYYCSPKRYAVSQRRWRGNVLLINQYRIGSEQLTIKNEK